MCAPGLQRDIYGDSNSRMLSVVHVISVIDEVDIDIVGIELRSSRLCIIEAHDGSVQILR